ncbi:hypothetical protein N7520_000291 [Penicillium odoratum]|uniref:uncharacterized protein n=1 Tax=Penicillium odoratum TaxID=1167516 RepID=UPI002549713F|nr:uncharacterized protein N7520_000291 [Penicillium odoratum]KAJ5777045.1 hypothetical protein N7520_000291 [Penicillium odoratum]
MPPSTESDSDIQARHKSDRKLPRQPKRIIICCDGTWQSAVSGEKNVPSNVTRLCRAINPFGSDAHGNQWPQIVWYDSGVGTTSLTMGTAIEGATGQGLEGNVVEAYNFCVLNYNPGDQIMVFGFSRGAFTARTIAGVITDIGLCHQEDLNNFPELWTHYKAFKNDKKNAGKRFFRSETWCKWLWGEAKVKDGHFFIEESSRGAPGNGKTWATQDDDWAQEGSRTVDVVGVYDTVGAIGMPEVGGLKIPQWMLFWKDSAEWHNVGLSTHVKHAFQALALDERRKAFEPTLFYIPSKPNDEEEKDELERLVRDTKKIFETERQSAEKLKAQKNSTDADKIKIAESFNKAALAWNNALRNLVNYEDSLKDPTKLAQVWFPGYHIHIGGGSSETLEAKDNMEEMSNIAYAWMLDQVKKHLSLNEQHIEDEYVDRKRNFKIENKKCEDWNDKISKESWGATAWRYSSKAASTIVHPLTAGPEPGFKEKRSYDWGTGEMKDSFTKMYYANGEHHRTPGRYDVSEKGQLLETCEFIHPVVKYRFEHPVDDKKEEERQKYQWSKGGPKFDRQFVPQNGDIKAHYVWKLEYPLDKKVVTLKEWPIGGPGCYERKAIVSERAKEWVNKMDNELNGDFKRA